MPTLEDGDLVLTEAAAIMMHIADRFPAAGLARLSERERAPSSPIGSHTSRPRFQTAYMRWFYPERFTTDPDGAAGVRAAAEAALRRHVEWTDAQLAARQWLVGEERTAADLYLFMMTRWGRRLEPPAWNSPHLGAHFARLLERPGVRRMMSEQGLLE